jgi:nicotinamide phosphoribosyltransferase
MNKVDRKIQQVAEMLLLRDLIEKYPIGILSIVSDTFNLWDVCTEYLPRLKEEILARDGKLVIRPDSGDPVDILCGKKSTIMKLTPDEALELYSSENPNIIFLNENDNKYYKIICSYEDAEWYLGKMQYEKHFDYDVYEFLQETELPNSNTNEDKGVIELLWDLFGGTVNEQGYKVLDSHIGAIYGDSITTDRANEICRRLEAKGFASTNVVLGIGSFTYQYNTRDTFGLVFSH